MSEVIEGLADIEVEEVIGWIVWVDGLRPLWDTVGPKVFTDYREATEARGWLDALSPVTAADLERARLRFGAKNGNGDWCCGMSAAR